MKKFAVFGNPIKQSLSPVIHQEFAKQAGIDVSYIKLLSSAEKFNSDISTFFSHKQVVGCNVTAPFKEQAFKLADLVHQSARIAGAANTLKKAGEKIEAHNTDGDGLVLDLLRLQGSIANKNILLLGAGGAAKGVLFPILQQNIKSLTIANRTIEKAQELAVLTQEECVFFSSLDKLEGHYDIVINSTSASLSGQAPELGLLDFTQTELTYDMNYSASSTLFIEAAKDRGSQFCSDGLGMLIGQAAVAFEIWTGFSPTTETLITTLREDRLV